MSDAQREQDLLREMGNLEQDCQTRFRQIEQELATIRAPRVLHFHGDNPPGFFGQMLGSVASSLFPL